MGRHKRRGGQIIERTAEFTAYTKKPTVFRRRKRRDVIRDKTILLLHKNGVSTKVTELTNIRKREALRRELKNQKARDRYHMYGRPQLSARRAARLRSSGLLR